MLHVVVMAGGAGRNFWPRSRRKTPKHLIHIFGEGTTIQQTVKRIKKGVSPEQIYVITNIEQAEATSVQLPCLPHNNIIAEPCGRDTAACIGLAATIIQKKDADAVMAAVTADHLIRPADRFVGLLNLATHIAKESSAIVTFGIKPTYPSTLFGYIHRGKKVEGGLPACEAAGFNDSPVFEVLQFKEKPDKPTAEEYLRTGEYYWNSGMFVWKVEVILSEIERNTPHLHKSLCRISDALGTSHEESVIATEYEKLDKISIDYAVMEKARNVKVIEANFEWDDVGSWQAIERLHGSDSLGNSILATHYGIDTENCIIVGDEKHLIATLGVKDLVIVHTPDATLVCNKENAPKIKELVDELELQGLTDYL